MMKSKSIAYMLVAAGLALVSCDDFLDKMPDDRAEINTAEKVTKLLVSAYPETTPYLMQEMASDNVTDNGAEYQKGGLTQEEAYLWKDFTGSENDAPRAVWNNTPEARSSEVRRAMSEEGIRGFSKRAEPPPDTRKRTISSSPSPSTALIAALVPL